MARDRQRLTLDSGWSVDLARLPIRRLAGRPARFSLRFSDGSTVGVMIRFDDDGGELTLVHDGGRQTFRLRRSARHFGGGQWFVVCPETGRGARVLRRLPGSRRFRSRHAFGRVVAYQSQFLDASGRAWRVLEKIKARLIGNHDPGEWDLPPKPKRMRWATYHRFENRYDEAEAVLDRELCLAAARLMQSGFRY